jgi:hypothetical protein
MQQSTSQVTEHYLASLDIDKTWEISTSLYLSRYLFFKQRTAKPQSFEVHPVLAAPVELNSIFL